MKKYLLIFLSLILVGCGGGSDSLVPAPAKPTMITVTGGDAQVILSWAAATGANSYNIHYGTASGVTTAGTKITGATSGNAITGLTNGITYYFVATAVGAGGESPVSSEVSATPQIPAPGVPSGITGTGGNAQVNLAWTTVTGATSYNVYYGTATGVTTAGVKIAGATSGNAITGLTNGTTYYFVVTAVNAGGESSVSSEVGVTTQVTAPVKPTAVAIIGGDAQVTLGWAPVSGATSYIVYYDTAAGVSTAGAKIIGAISGNTITGLTNGATYYFVVTAVNAGGESPVSSEVSTTPQTPTPGVPSGVSVIGGDAKVNLGWAAVTGATSYNVYYGTSAGVTTTGTRIAGATSGNAITGLTNGVTYYFVVTAVNTGGESLASFEVNATPNTPPLRAPSGVTVTGGNAQVTFGWTAVAGATSYNVYYGTTAGITIAGTPITGATSGNAITGLMNGATYYFVVTAINASGESPVSSEVSATPQIPVPGVPAGITVTGGDAQATLSWSAVTGATSYNVYYGTVAGVIPVETKTTGATSGNAVTGLTNGTTYYFVVTAMNATGESPVSSIVSATPQFPPGMTYPSTSTAKNISDVLATLTGSFTNPAGYTTEAWFEWGVNIAYGSFTGSSFYAYPGSIRPSNNVSPIVSLSQPVGTTYHYRFCTKNVDGKWCGDDKMFTTIPMAVKTTLAPNLLYPVQFAVDATNIYWTEGGVNGAVKKAPLGGGAVTILASILNDPTLNDPFGIAVDAVNVYWTEQGSGSVKMVPIAGGVVTTLVPAPVPPALNKNPQFIAVDATSVYFTELGSWNSAAGMRNADGTVSKVPIIGGAVAPLATLLNGPQTIKVDAANIYWTEVANYIGGAGSVKQVPIIGGTVITLVPGLSGSQNIAVDATDVYYWSGYGTMARLPIGGATLANPIVEVASGMNGTQPLAVDSTGVYWTETSNTGTVKKLNKASGNVTVLTSGLIHPQAIVLDATGVYWMEGSTFGGASWNPDGVIRKILK